MQKKYKTDYFSLLNTMAQICIDNIEKKTTANKGSNLFKEIRYNLHKDYFTPFEREDIFLLAFMLYDLSICTYKLQHSSINRFTDFTSVQTASDAVKIVYNIISNLDNNNFFRSERSAEFFEQLELSEISNISYFTEENVSDIISKTIICCKKIAACVEYIIIKNS